VPSQEGPSVKQQLFVQVPGWLIIAVFSKQTVTLLKVAQKLVSTMHSSSSSRIHVRCSSGQRRAGSSKTVKVSSHPLARLFSQVRGQLSGQAPSADPSAEPAADPINSQDGNAGSPTAGNDMQVDDDIADNAEQLLDHMFQPQGVRFSVAASQSKPRSAEANRLAADKNWRQQQEPTDWIGCLEARRALVQSEQAVLTDYLHTR
jgi:hypothetical protein